MQATVQREIQGEQFHAMNDRFGWRFFPRDIARSAFFFRYPVAKSPGTFRIFVLGGSAAQGDPERAYSFSRILSVMLRSQYPDTNFEVINTAITATNSHVVREVAADIANHDPDLMIVYLGNNEVVGPFGAANPLIPYSGHKSYIRTKLWVNSTKIGQLFENVGQALAAKSEEPRSWMGMEEFTRNQVRHDDESLSGVYEHYEENLEDICDVAEANGVPLILSTMSVNLRDCAPFASVHRPDLSKEDLARWEQAHSQGAVREREGDYAAAVEQYEKAAAMDAEFANLQFRLGRCYWELQDYPKAEEHFRLARDYDTLRFRADSRINQILQDVAKRRQSSGIHLLDVEDAIAKASPHGIPGREMFYEHVHFTFHGNYLLARTTFEEVEELLPSDVQKNRADRPLPSEQECAAALGMSVYNDLDVESEVLRRLENPPFTNQLNIQQQHAHQVSVIEDIQKHITEDSPQELRQLYEQAIEAAPDDYLLHEMYGVTLLLHRNDTNRSAALRREDAKLAAEELKMAHEMGNEAAGIQAYIGLALILADQADEAEPWIVGCLNADPKSEGGHYALGRLRLEQGRAEEAIEPLEKALQRRPTHTEYLYYLAEACADAGEKERARELLQKVVTLDAQAFQAHRMLAQLFSENNETARALSHLQHAVKIRPGHAGTLNEIAWLLATSPDRSLRNPAQAILAAETVVAHRAANPSYLDTLAACYASAGRYQDAIEAAEKALVNLPPGQVELEEDIRGRLELYRAGESYIDHAQRP